MPKVSVIIPVYNVEPYLRNCLDSVINQTLKDIEIICINDGSTDNSLSVLNEYKSKDNRIVVIDKKNEGVAITRNLGIKIVSGDYISFIDADDYLETNTFYEKLYTCALETNSDIVKGNYKFNNQVLNVVNNKIKENKIYFIAEFASAIYKTAFIKNNDIKFPILSDMEDPNFAFKCAIYANKIEIVDDANYVIVENPNSITRKKNSYSQLMDKLKGLKLLIKIANNSNIDINEFSYMIALR